MGSTVWLTFKEAAAYCRWRGGSLPTLYHWARAALPSSDVWLPFNHLLAAASYIVLNPVRAGLVERPDDWRWSSYRATAGLDDAPGLLDVEPLLEMLAADRDSARSRYAEMVEAILKDKKKILPCSAYLEGEYGVKGQYLGVPVKLGARGIEQIIEISLEPEEKAALMKSAAAVKELVDVIKM